MFDWNDVIFIKFMVVCIVKGVGCLKLINFVGYLYINVLFLGFFGMVFMLDIFL